MKKKLSIFVLLISACFVNAQVKAVTENGDEVVLYKNGTYKYLNDDLLDANEITLNAQEFSKPVNASFLLKSQKTNVGFWLDPKLWKFGKPQDNPDAEYELELRGEDLYGVIISEKVEFPLINLRDIALENARSVAPDIQIIEQDFRMVNNNKVLFLRMDGTMQGMNVSYYGYFFSSEKGTTQFILYTAQNLLEDYKSIGNDLLNGLVVVE